ncbi:MULTISPECIES: ABC transporter permease [Acidithrix]|uniref:Dipeptide transport system permease protein DppB n=1 Tax=Acidithrix ferrooxidans TaxID=1280514 RepID=A0A0D8HGA1_9ACTN|nr:MULTISPECIES: ABC transporter permease [Acidithrix]KJF16106.1 dipeptide transport system permease protein DppB [Acidithrix ferrooxidans]CAG4904941.1 unnamed protein product [Acidithrix sp. C25]
MIAFLVRRIGQSIVVLIGVSIIAFILEHLLPGGPAKAIIGPRATPIQIAAFNHQNGLDKPVVVQYFVYMWHLLQGNLGRSYKLNQTVNSILIRTVPESILLVGSALVFSLIIAIPIGIYQAVKRNGIFDYTATSISFLLYSMPSFWLGIILILFLAVNVHFLPAEAPQGANLGAILAHPSGLVLPILTLTLVSYASFSRYMRSSAIEALAQDWIRTAKAKGLSQRTILFKHMLRNALIPIATLVGLSLPSLITAGVITESVFNFPGTGFVFINAANTEDYSLLLGIIIFVGVLTVVGNLIADIAYAVLDPRVRYR